MAGEENLLRQNLHKANRRLLIGCCLSFVGTITFILRIVFIQSDADVIWWIAFGIGVLVKVVGWILIIPAKSQRYQLTIKLQKVVVRIPQTAIPPPDSSVPSTLHTDPPPPAYTTATLPTAPSLSQLPDEYNEPPPPYSETD